MSRIRGEVLLMVWVLMLTLTHAWAQERAIVIQDQGSFAVGGSVITNPGTFDPIKRTSERQTFHGDHAYVYHQINALADYPDKFRTG
jgi:hypothetical protein